MASAQTLLEEVTEAYAGGDYNLVRSLTKDLSPKTQVDTEVYWHAGRACQSLDHYAEAIEHFETFANKTEHASRATKAMTQVARIQEKIGDLTAAAETMIACCNQQPTNADAQRYTAHLLDLAGRRLEANTYHLKLVKAGKHTLDDLTLLSDRHEPYVPVQLEEILNRPGEEAFCVARALVAWRSGKTAEAEQLLQPEIAQNQAAVHAHALLGLVLLDQGKIQELATWNAQLPATAASHPDVWYTRGVWAKHLGRPNVATLCFREALNIDPNYGKAIFQLSASASPDPAHAEMSQRIKILEQYRSSCRSIFFRGAQFSTVLKAIDQAEALGRFPEAIGWCRILRSQPGFGETIRERLARLQSAEKIASADGVFAVKHADERIKLLNAEIPAWPTPAATASDKQPSVFPVVFNNEAVARNLQFEYDNGSSSESGLMIRQSMGGGVAVIDFDLDAWPDVFFPQGRSKSSTGTNQLFRNRPNHGFIRVDETARYTSPGYSHGAAAGDVNNDGFPDLYVANSGKNELYINNGDGTFRAAANSSGPQKWTVSCVIADLNGDAFPELFDVNYLEWDRPFSEVCVDDSLKLPRTCPPERFKGERNELHLNSGNGDFHEVSVEAGIGEILGKSLGVIAADFDDSGTVSLFVANDQVPNTYLRPSSRKPGTNVPTFSNRANEDGLAYNDSGEALACMGIAAADVNHDGQLDMFVTNFYRQPNTLYVAIGGGGFQDLTGPSGLLEPGRLKLGFGAQFLDANLDGEQDLIIGNGHLDDFTQKDIPFKMQSQLFLNAGEMQFVENTQAGEFFAERHLTRGLAKLDWNRDGLPDVVASQLNERAALLTNQTPTHGHFLSVRLIGTKSSRDAVGATVTVETNSHTQSSQVTAGDGYASSNQKDITFGLGTETAKSIRIKWPSGHVDAFAELQADGHYVAVEEAKTLYLQLK